MHLRQTVLSPALRSLAAVVLVAFVTAQTLCFAHCNLGGRSCDKAAPSCQTTGATQACHSENDSSSSSRSRTATCFTLQGPVITGEAPALVIPDFSVFYLLTPCAIALEATAPKLDAVFSRQANHSDWVLTPEVSLGPAFRSLAPPSLV